MPLGGEIIQIFLTRPSGELQSNNLSPAEQDLPKSNMTKFFLYARKSTENEERQILSIEAQLRELRQLASKEGLEIVDELIESKTAKEPGRPIFNQMLKRIEKGEAKGILAWHPDRLARNSVDGGKIIYLIDTGKIRELKFPCFWFEPTPQGKFMLNIAFGQSKYYVDNLSENVKRGLRQKLKRGEWPGLAPIGYLNDLKTHTIIKDPKKFRLIKKLFKLYSAGEYSLKNLENLSISWGLISQRKRKGLAVSIIQRILQNNFYIGLFTYKGETYQGKHEPMIAKKLFDKVQKVMKDKSSPKKRSQKFYAFRGLFKCAQCGCSITSQTQKGHIYYNCTKKRGSCPQPYIREELLVEQISNILQKVSLGSVWSKKMIAELKKEKQQKAQTELCFAQNLKKQIKEIDEKLDKLLDARLEGIISRDEYIIKKQKILNQKIEKSEKLKDFEQNCNHWLELAQNFILQAKQAEIIALQGNFSEKKNFLKKIGLNLLLDNREILFTPRNAWKLTYNFAAERQGREAAPSVSTKFPVWRWGQDSNLQAPCGAHAFQACALPFGAPHLDFYFGNLEIISTISGYWAANL